MDGLLNLEHCTEIELNKNQKKDDETVGTNTTMSVLTNVSPQTQGSQGKGAWATPLDMDISDPDQNATHVMLTLTSPKNVELEKLESENKKQKQEISNMKNQLAKLENLVRELVSNCKWDEDERESRSKWQTGIIVNMEELNAKAKNDQVEQEVFSRRHEKHGNCVQ